MALLRGVNVGGKNRLPMRDLAALFAKAGAEEAETFIQSGNVVFRARPRVAARLPETVAAAIFERYGHRTPILTRTVAELAELVRANPFAKAGVDLATLHVAFLRDPPSAERVAALDAARSPPDEFLVRKREIYLRLPNGVARTRLTNAWFDSALATTATLRNWRTVQRLLELAGRRSRDPRGGRP